MATADPIQRILENVVRIQRIGNAINAEAQAILDELFDAIAEDLRRIDPTAPEIERWRRYRTDQFLEVVDERLSRIYPQWRRAVERSLVDVAVSQGDVARQILIATLGGQVRVAGSGITRERARAILETDPFGDDARGKALLSEWAESLERTTRERITRQIRLGMLNEESIDDLVRRIRGTQAGYVRRDPRTGQFVPPGTRGAVVSPRFVGGVYQMTTRDAESLVRTAVSHVSNRAMLETYEANADIIAAYVFTAVLDDRTTLICGNLDGSRWKPNDPGLPVPPLHWGCRSVLTPEPDWRKLGLPEPEPGERAARDLTGVSAKDLERKVSARRRTGDLGRQATVSSSTTYEQWLRSQPAKVQDKVLGATRAKLFREGRVTLRELIRSDGTLIPLSELLRAA